MNYLLKRFEYIGLSRLISVPLYIGFGRRSVEMDDGAMPPRKCFKLKLIVCLVIPCAAVNLCVMLLEKKPINIQMIRTKSLVVPKRCEKIDFLHCVGVLRKQHFDRICV